MRQSNRAVIVVIGLLIVIAVAAVVIANNPNLFGTAGEDQLDATSIAEIAQEPTTAPPTDVPPTDVPPTEVPPTDLPPTDVPPTAVLPPTEVVQITPVPPTDVPQITPVPPTEVVPPTVEQLVPPTVEQITPVPPTEEPTVEQITPVPPTEVVQITPVPPTDVPPTEVPQNTPVPPTDAVPAVECFSYTVQAGDTFDSLAELATGGTGTTYSADDLRALNPGVTDLQAGQVLCLPRINRAEQTAEVRDLNATGNVYVPPTEFAPVQVSGSPGALSVVGVCNSYGSYEGTPLYIASFIVYANGGVINGLDLTLRSTDNVFAQGFTRSQPLNPGEHIEYNSPPSPNREWWLDLRDSSGTSVRAVIYCGYDQPTMNTFGTQTAVVATQHVTQTAEAILRHPTETAIAYITQTADANDSNTAVAQFFGTLTATASSPTPSPTAVPTDTRVPEMRASVSLNCNAADLGYRIMVTNPDTSATIRMTVTDPQGQSQSLDMAVTSRITGSIAYNGSGEYRFVLTVVGRNGVLDDYSFPCTAPVSTATATVLLPTAVPTNTPVPEMRASVSLNCNAADLGYRILVTNPDTSATIRMTVTDPQGQSQSLDLPVTSRMTGSIAYNGSGEYRFVLTVVGRNGILDDYSFSCTAPTLTPSPMPSLTPIVNVQGQQVTEVPTLTPDTAVANAPTATLDTVATNMPNTAAPATAVPATDVPATIVLATNVPVTATALAPTLAQAAATTVPATNVPATEAPVTAPTATEAPASSTAEPTGAGETCSTVTTAPPEIVAALDALLAEYLNPTPGQYLIEAQPAPGVVIRVESPDWIYYKSAGLGVVETRQPLYCEDPFEIGSNTKMMTTTVLLQLHEAGQLNIDDLLSAYLPDYAAALPFGDRVTLRQLANHTSGIWDYAGEVETGGIIADGLADPEALRRGFTADELVQYAIDNGEPYFEPGAEGQWHYSNTNYALIGLIIEQVTGQALGDVYRERIFAPLGMDDTYLWNDVPQADMGLPQAYYIAPFDVNTSEWNLSQGWAAGGVVSTADDMAKFITALLNGDLFEQPETLALMQEGVFAPGVLSTYGIGLMSSRDNTWGHNGQTMGFESTVVYNTTNGISIVVWTNSAENLAALGSMVVVDALEAAGITP